MQCYTEIVTDKDQERTGSLMKLDTTKDGL